MQQIPPTVARPSEGVDVRAPTRRNFPISASELEVSITSIIRESRKSPVVHLLALASTFFSHSVPGGIVSLPLGLVDEHRITSYRKSFEA